MTVREPVRVYLRPPQIDTSLSGYQASNSNPDLETRQCGWSMVSCQHQSVQNIPSTTLPHFLAALIQSQTSAKNLASHRKCQISCASNKVV